MKNIAQFTSNQYTKIRNDFAEKYPDDCDVTTSSMFFSLLIGQYISDIIRNSNNLDADYHAALLEMINVNVKQYIDLTRKDDDLVSVDWVVGKDLLKQI